MIEYLTIGEVARRLGVPRGRLAYLVESGQVPAPSASVPGRRLFTEADIELIQLVLAEIQRRPGWGGRMSTNDALFQEDQVPPPDDEAGPLTGAPDPSDLLAQLDHQAAEILTRIRRGQAPSAAQAVVDEFLQFLAGFTDAIPLELIGQHLERLRAALRKAGHRAERVERYVATIRALVGSGPDVDSVGYHVVAGASPAAEGRLPGTYHANRRLANFSVILAEDIEIRDGNETTRRFRGTIEVGGTVDPIELSPEDLASEKAFQQAVFTAAGPTAVFFGTVAEVRRAMSSTSTPAKRRVTTDFGWTGDGGEFWFPSGVVSPTGVRAATADDRVRVDLSGVDRACHLDLRCASAERLAALRRHLAEDFVGLHGRAVTLPLLGVVALAVLWRWVPPEFGRFAVWLVGATGNGKTFLLKLVQRFFGRFPDHSGLASWASTANYIERVGYGFKDAVFAVDDFKADLAARAAVLRIVQSYADAAARGRLRTDATTNTSRPIRGQLVCTGEDLIEASASALARAIPLPVPQREQDLARGQRCVRESGDYPAVTADFIGWLLAGGRATAFAAECRRYADEYLGHIPGVANGPRIAGNFGVLAAAIAFFGEYLAQDWAAGPQIVREFLDVCWRERLREMTFASSSTFVGGSGSAR